MNSRRYLPRCARPCMGTLVDVDRLYSRDRSYLRACQDHQLKCHPRGGFLAGSGLHYDQHYNGPSLKFTIAPKNDYVENSKYEDPIKSSEESDVISITSDSDESYESDNSDESDNTDELDNSDESDNPDFLRTPSDGTCMYHACTPDNTGFQLRKDLYYWILESPSAFRSRSTPEQIESVLQRIHNVAVYGDTEILEAIAEYLNQWISVTRDGTVFYIPPGELSQSQSPPPNTPMLELYYRDAHYCRLNEYLSQFEVDEGSLCQIARILRPRIIDHIRMYQVQWKGYDDPTWESRKKLIHDVPSIIREFESRFRVKWHQDYVEW